MFNNKKTANKKILTIKEYLTGSSLMNVSHVY